MNIAAFADRLEAALPGQVERDATAAALTTYRVGGPIGVLVRASSVADLAAIAAVGPLPPTMVVGRGSNLLVADAGFPGLVVMLEGEFGDVTVEGDEVRVGGGMSLPIMARRIASAGRTGLEFYVGIPGSVGGAVRMNAGGHGQETANVLLRAGVIDLADGPDAAVEERPVDAFDYRYRYSNLASTAVVTHAVFASKPDQPDACLARIDEIVRWRRENQPGGANAGSVFRNPPDDAAGRLIEAAGLKGLRIGGAVVSDKHANFIQAEEGATAQDVRDLVATVQRRIAEETGVALQTEIHFVGFADYEPADGGASA